MSKLDAQRAMREAKYARNRANGPSRPEAPAVGGASRTPTAQTPQTKPAPATRAAAPEDGERCGHKSMNGRVCTRAAAHSEKSHRYS